MTIDLRMQLTDLLADAGLDSAIETLTACNSGGNNRAYRLDTCNGTFAVKQYFDDECNRFDRLDNEFTFLAYASRVAPAMVPAPLAIDRKHGLALYEFVDGRQYQPNEVNRDLVHCAAEFFLALNEPEARTHAIKLPTAAEACFSVEQHLQLIDSRLARLRNIEPGTSEDREAQSLVNEISIRWKLLSEEVLAAMRATNRNPEMLLEPEQRCISPSDFGFHNAVAQYDGSTRFLDFEYAGWDDPAKMAGDFFSQLAVPVPIDYFDQFVREISVPFPDPDELIFRARLLRPVYQIKWCCIALNSFLPIPLARRKFSNPDLDERALKRAQLTKVNTLFKSSDFLCHGFN